MIAMAFDYSAPQAEDRWFGALALKLLARARSRDIYWLRTDAVVVERSPR
jgi:hypothetical protein